MKLYKVIKPFGGYSAGAVIQLNETDAERHKDCIEPLKKDKKADAQNAK